MHYSQSVEILRDYCEYITQPECNSLVIELKHYQDNMPLEYHDADVLVLPLKSLRGVADIPISLLEAYASGLPVIATNIGGIPEIVSNEFLFPLGDSNALADRIIHVLSHNDNPENLRKISLQHSWDIVSRRYLKIFKDVLKETSS